MRFTSTGAVRLYRLCAIAIGLAAAFLLKWYYREAGSEDLAWIIGPAAFFAEVFSPLEFVHEAGYGWVDFSHRVVIAPACAGINFMIIAFCMATVQLSLRLRTPAGILAGVAAAGLLSYAAALLANVLRIVIATWCYRLEFPAPWATPAAVHRLVGICVFYLVLCGYSRALSAWLEGYAPRQHPSGEAYSPPGRLLFLVPLAWYLAISVGMPLATAVLARRTPPAALLDHALIVTAVAVVLTALLRKGSLRKGSNLYS